MKMVLITLILQNYFVNEAVCWVLGLCKKVFAAFGVRILFWGCVKRFFLALRAKLCLDGGIFFLILRSKIRKKMRPSKEYGAV